MQKIPWWGRRPLEHRWGIAGQVCAMAYLEEASLQGDRCHFSPPRGVLWPSRKRFLRGLDVGCRLTQPGAPLAARLSETPDVLVSTRLEQNLHFNSCLNNISEFKKQTTRGPVAVRGRSDFLAQSPDQNDFCSSGDGAHLEPFFFKRPCILLLFDGR